MQNLASIESKCDEGRRRMRLSSHQLFWHLARNSTLGLMTGVRTMGAPTTHVEESLKPAPCAPFHNKLEARVPKGFDMRSMS